MKKGDLELWFVYQAGVSHNPPSQKSIPEGRVNTGPKARVGLSWWLHDTKAGHSRCRLVHQLEAGGMSPEGPVMTAVVSQQEECAFCFLGDAKNWTVLKIGKLFYEILSYIKYHSGFSTEDNPEGRQREGGETCWVAGGKVNLPSAAATDVVSASLMNGP